MAFNMASRLLRASPSMFALIMVIIILKPSWALLNIIIEVKVIRIIEYHRGSGLRVTMVKIPHALKR